MRRYLAISTIAIACAGAAEPAVADTRIYDPMREAIAIPNNLKVNVEYLVTQSTGNTKTRQRLLTGNPDFHDGINLFISLAGWPIDDPSQDESGEGGGGDGLGAVADAVGKAVSGGSGGGTTTDGGTSASTGGSLARPSDSGGAPVSGGMTAQQMADYSAKTEQQAVDKRFNEIVAESNAKAAAKASGEPGKLPSEKVAETMQAELKGQSSKSAKEPIVQLIEFISLMKQFVGPMGKVGDVLTNIAAVAQSNLPSSVQKNAEKNGAVAQRIAEQNEAMPPPGRRQIEVDWEKMGPYVNCDLIGQNKDAPEDSSKIAEAMKKLLLDRRGGQEHHAKVQADLNKSMVFTSAGTMGRALSALQFVADWKYGRQQLKEFVSDNSATEQAHMAALMGMKAQTYTLTSLKQSLDNASLEVLSMRAVYGMAGKVEAAQ